MPNWVASTRTPAEKPKDLDDLIVHAGDRRSKKVKAQMEAATKAAGLLMGTLEGKAVVTISGHSADEEMDLDRITVVVTRV